MSETTQNLTLQIVDLLVMIAGGYVGFVIVATIIQKPITVLGYDIQPLSTTQNLTISGD
jgi:UDP-N-acetyl-D-mannosaminuronate dehydrogenase